MVDIEDIEDLSTIWMILLKSCVIQIYAIQSIIITITLLRKKHRVNPSKIQ